MLTALLSRQSTVDTGRLRRKWEMSEKTPPIHPSGCSSPTQIREYVNTHRTIHPSIHSRRPSVPCGCCTCLEFIATQCSVYVVAGTLLSASRLICSLLHFLADTQRHLRANFCTVSLQQFLCQRHLNHIHSFIYSFGKKNCGPQASGTAGRRWR